jgi:hypothetical protein
MLEDTFEIKKIYPPDVIIPEGEPNPPENGLSEEAKCTLCSHVWVPLTAEFGCIVPNTDCFGKTICIKCRAIGQIIKAKGA